MKPGVLFLVTSDPRISPRPAEAVRIAAGVGVWEKLDVTLCLRGPAVLALGADAEELVEGESFARHLPLLAGAGRPIFAQPAGLRVEEPAAPAVRATVIDDAQLAALAARSRCVVRF